MYENNAARRVRTTLKARQMVLLVALNDAGNIHQAARETNMSPPAASKMLKDMEELFGVPLFERLPRGVRPTIYGKTLISHVRLALANLEHGQESIAALKAGLSGQVNIGIIITSSMTLVPQAIVRTKSEAPRLSIGVEVGTSKDLIDRMKRDELDFLIARIQEQEDEHSLLYEDLSEEIVCVVARKGHPLASRNDLSLNDLSVASWILTARGSILRNRFDMMFRRADLEVPYNVIETTAMSLVIRLLQSTDFLHVIPLDMARSYVESGDLAILPIDIPCRMESFGIIMRRDTVLSPGANVLLNQIRAVAAELYP